ncbi:MAG: futalosine hydrolase [Chitinophagaceae bacterium]
MNCLVIAATAGEIGPFADRLKLAGPAVQGISILITGVGLTATTYSLTRELVFRRPDRIIQAGIAGCFDQTLALGSVFTVGSDLVADQGVFEREGWKSTVDMGYTPANSLPYSNGWLVNPDAGNPSDLPRVKAVSVNQVSTDPRLVESWKNRYQPTLETMEGAALHYVALSENIPFLQLRAVSNYVGERDKKNWDIKNAIINLNKELQKLLPLP